jgi:hypothetical protein
MIQSEMRSSGMRYPVLVLRDFHIPEELFTEQMSRLAVSGRFLETRWQEL